MNRQIGWRRQGLIRVPVVVPAPAKSELLRFTDEERRNYHAAYVRGARDPFTIAGHREWDKLYRRARRSRLSSEDRAWCERAAVSASWQQFEQANRKRVNS